jgi:hypothetical protein
MLQQPVQTRFFWFDDFAQSAGIVYFNDGRI